MRLLSGNVKMFDVANHLTFAELKSPVEVAE